MRDRPDSLILPYPTPYPQNVHRLSTVSTQLRPVVHRMWKPYSSDCLLRCHAVGQTPTYDQLRGERINADVPASETDPYPFERPGRHRLKEDIPDSDPPGRHRLRTETPAAAAVCDSSPRPGADLTEGWSWFEVREPSHRGRSIDRHTTGSLHSDDIQDIQAVGQQADADPREPVPYVRLPPPAHARENSSAGTLGASHNAKADPFKPTTTLSRSQTN